MILKSIKLQNIRSYIEESIEFPVGSLLLAGDIGCGKSTILQAIEFALFGIKREMPGSSLLRYGCNTGSVELVFSLHGKDILIKRTLKRGKSSVAQDTGYIIQDELKKEGTATELKTIIFEMLGYPTALIRSKDLIYRYTVYTPQEHMKAILTEDSRLDILRRVFNIDKYKRIKENSVLFIREIKEQIKRFEGIFEGIEDKESLKKQNQSKLEQTKTKFANLIPLLEEKCRVLEEKKSSIVNIEKDIQYQKDIKNKLQVLETDLKNKIEQRVRNLEGLNKLNYEIDELEKDETIKTKIDVDNIKKEIDLKNNEIQTIENEIKDVNFKLNEIEIKSRHSKELKEKINSLSHCPTCKQDVSELHKTTIIEFENKKITSLAQNLVVQREKEQSHSENIDDLKKALDILKEKERNFDLISLKLKNLQEQKTRQNSIILEQEQIKKEIGKINMGKIEISSNLKDISIIEIKYNEIKKEIEILLEAEKELNMQKATFNSEIKNIESIIENLSQEINEKQKAAQKIKELRKNEEWLNGFFIELISLMEKQVMLNLHNEFNELLVNWFNILIEDENISVRLNEEFSPVILQNEYEAGVENLSGGEKTSLALAYRLSLNKVINDFVDTIQTKDIIILDEPTDGFSTEQLDKVRDVLEQLAITQVIIVSHENKVEGFVDNVIRIQKEDHISRIIS